VSPPPRPTNPPLVPRPEQVTPAWLTDMLRGAGRIGRARVTSVAAQPVGTGQMGDSVRFRLAYDRHEADAPDSVVVKFAAADPTSRSTGLAMRSYEIEVRFYQQVAATVDIRTPRCDFAAIDLATGEFTLVLEDLAPAVQGDQLAGCTPDEAALALGELARLHAPRWGDPTLRHLEWLHRSTPERVRVGETLLPQLFAGFAERYGPRLEPEFLAVAERLVPLLPRYLREQPEPWAVQHGDYRLDNMLFGTSEGGAPLTVVDWQTAVHGPPLADAAYFLGAGLLPDERRRREVDLLREYHRTLRAGGVEAFDWDRCWCDYRRFTFAGFIMAVAASMLVVQTERGDEMFLTMARRHGAHILDLDAEALWR
jgi:aminoglycoside/choline kinase family phosphotransferase